MCLGQNTWMVYVHDVAIDLTEIYFKIVYYYNNCSYICYVFIFIVKGYIWKNILVIKSHNVVMTFEMVDDITAFDYCYWFLGTWFLYGRICLMNVKLLLRSWSIWSCNLALKVSWRWKVLIDSWSLKCLFSHYY